MAKFSQQFAQKEFVGTTMKKAYMDAVKWYATNVMANEKMSNSEVMVTFEKANENGIPKVIVKLYVALEESEIMDEHCEICREMHHSFFINEQNDCSRCAALGYSKRMEEHIARKKGYYNEMLDKKEEGHD